MSECLRFLSVGLALPLDQPTSQCPFSMTSRPSAVIRPLCSRVDDQVPVQGRIVDAAGLGIALAEREVDGPADLFIVEDAAGEAIDAAVEPQSQLAQPPGAGVEVEHRQQVVFTLRRPGPARPVPRETPG